MKTKLLLYCTKGEPVLQRDKTNGYCRIWQEKNNRLNCDYLNGKIVAECECEVEEFEWWSNSTYDDGYFNKYGKDITKELCKKSCLTYEQLFNYIGGVNNGYALHLSNIKVFEKPLKLDDCEHCKKINMGTAKNPVYIDNIHWVWNAPQNMMRVIFNKENYVLVSIRPEWLCKILNGEKTVEVRRKILKGML